MKLLNALLVFALVPALCGCGATGDPEPAQPSEVIQEEVPMDIISFSFTHTGMSKDDCFRYSARQTREGIRLYTEELFSGGSVVDTLVDDPVLEQLGEMAERHRLDRWDGFDKTDRRVMDGSSFSLSAELADGSTIYARGSNAFPEGYPDVESEICALFECLIDRHRGAGTGE